MELVCQAQAISQLSDLKSANVHSIIISGPQSSGKSYLSKKYADMLEVSDFYIIQPKVSELRETIESCSGISTPVVLCIENLDTGVFAASSAILKFLEEPSSNIYIIVTARNIKMLQDTIISRSHVVYVNPPTSSDLISYAIDKFPEEYRLYSGRDLWSCVKSFDDVELFLSMDMSQIQYIEDILSVLYKSQCVSDSIWAMQKYPDNQGDTPIKLVIRYIIYKCPDVLVDGIECIRQLELKRIANYAIISKFVFKLRCYWGMIQ